MSDDPDEEAGDPFADLGEAVGDRDGDPFDRIDEGLGEGGDSERAGAPGSEEHPSGAGRPDVSAPENSRRGDADPLSGRIEDPEPGVPSFPESAGRDGDPFDSFDDAFDQEEIDRLDPDAVWEELDGAQSGGSVVESKQRTYAEVSKHSYCEQCEHFSSPPEVRCGREGTRIVEFLDMETVRVVDCPVVEERKELRKDGHGKD